MRSTKFVVLAAIVAAATASGVSAMKLDDNSYIIPKGVVGKPYSHLFAMRPGGGIAPYHYRVLQGASMPPGLILGRDDGKVTGIPTQAGKFRLWIEGRDTGQAAGFWDMTTEREFEFEFLPALKIQPPKIPQALAKRPFSAKLAADGGGKQAWSVVSGKLPGGVSLAADGTLSGTPTRAGSFTFTVKLTDPEWDEYAVGVRKHMAGFRSDSRTVEIKVAKPDLAIVTSSLPAAVVGRPYNASLAAEDGAAPVKWSVAGGKLPTGLKLEATTGALTGSASRWGTYGLTVQAKDKSGAVSTRKLALTVITKTQADTAQFNIKDFGAKGDGKTDDTAAIQRAFDAAARVQGVVQVPSGMFMCHDLKMPRYISVVGNPNWDYRTPAGSILSLNHAEKATCLIDMSYAAGGTLNGLSIIGQKLGTNVHGVYFAPDRNRHEDTTRIERCQIRKFSGDGIHYGFSKVFSVRHCEIKNNVGNGIYLHGWDGWILDNWLADNGKAGFTARELNASVTMTGNRIEWNRGGGIVLVEGGHYNITGNYFDRCAGPSISLLPNVKENRPSVSAAITGNIFLGSGYPGPASDGYNSCHVYVEKASGVVVTGNTFFVTNMDGQENWSPNYGIVLKGLRNSVIMGNSLHVGATKELIVDLGEHKEGVVIKDNVGSLYKGPGPTWQSPQW